MPEPLHRLAPDTFLDTADGHAWALAAAEHLMRCEGLRINGREVIGPYALADKLAELTCEAFDPDGNFAAMILHAAMGEGDEARSNFEAFMGKDYVRDLAYQMVAEYAEEYAKSRGSEDYD